MYDNYTAVLFPLLASLKKFPMLHQFPLDCRTFLRTVVWGTQYLTTWRCPAVSRGSSHGVDFGHKFPVVHFLHTWFGKRFHLIHYEKQIVTFLLHLCHCCLVEGEQSEKAHPVYACSLVVCSITWPPITYQQDWTEHFITFATKNRDVQIVKCELRSVCARDWLNCTGGAKEAERTLQNMLWALSSELQLPRKHKANSHYF